MFESASVCDCRWNIVGVAILDGGLRRLGGGNWDLVTDVLVFIMI